MHQPTLSGSNINLVKAHNQQAILISLLHDSNLSRIQLADKTGLSTTTITNLINEMIDLGLVAEEGIQISNQRRKVGRPRTALRLIPEARYAMGVHIGIGVYRVAIVDLCANILYNSIREFSIRTPALDVLDQIANDIQIALDDVNFQRPRFIGIGIGASGHVNYQKGINMMAPNLGWNSVDIRHFMLELFDLPVVVDNNVRAMALGEAFFGRGRDVDSLAFVYGRIGVGAGFVFDGNIYRGSETGAGEIGHMVMTPIDGELCRCGKRGCLETLISEPVILAQAQVISKNDPSGILANQLNEDGNLKPIERVFRAARMGDVKTREMIHDRACYLGIALSTLVNLLNPELILLGGMFAQADDLILSVAKQKMQEMAFAGLGDNVRVEPTGYGWRAGVIGAGALALTNFFYQHQSPLKETA